MARRDRRGHVEGDLSDKQRAMLIRIGKDVDGELPKCVLEQAIYTKLEKRGFVSFERKEMVRITSQGRNMLNIAVASQ